jgi:hypothetical protein
MTFWKERLWPFRNRKRSVEAAEKGKITAGAEQKSDTIRLTQDCVKQIWRSPGEGARYVERKNA